jgi:hypothetical protein
MMSTKLKPLKPNPPKFVSDENLQNFLDEANNPEKSGSLFVSKAKKEELPWEHPHVREDLKKIFNIRLSEKDFIKLEYLARLKKESMHKICTDILIPQINRMLNL